MEAFEPEKGCVIAGVDSSWLYELTGHFPESLAVTLAAIVGMLWHLGFDGRDDRHNAPDRHGLSEVLCARL